MTRHVTEALVKLIVTSDIDGETLEESLGEMLDAEYSGEIWIDEIWTVEHD